MADLVSPTQRLCRTFRHAYVIKLALVLELRESRDGLFHGHSRIHACAFEQIEAFCPSQFFIDEVDAPCEILGA